MWPNPQETADLVTFTEEILNGKLHFLCSVVSGFEPLATIAKLLILGVKIVRTFLANNYLLKVYNGNTKTIYEICSVLIIKTLQQRQWYRSGVFIVKFEHISQIVVVFS